jgi:Tfp pilus assembly protein PilO
MAVKKLNEKQLLLVTIAGSLLFVIGFCGLIYWDLDRIYAAEITEENPEAAEITDQEEWGELRHIQEIEKQIEVARAEAEKIPQREQDVIVYREIVARDAAILPSEDEVNRLAVTIGDFERMAGVTLTRVSDLNTSMGKGAAIARIPIKLQLSGTFEETLKFINLFENLDRIVNVTQFNISGGRAKDTDADGNPRHAVTLDLETFMYSSKAGLAKPVEEGRVRREVPAAGAHQPARPAGRPAPPRRRAPRRHRRRGCGEAEGDRRQAEVRGGDAQGRRPSGAFLRTQQEVRPARADHQGDRREVRPDRARRPPGGPAHHDPRAA